MQYVDNGYHCLDIKSNVNAPELKQGRIHDIRCIPVLHYTIFSEFLPKRYGWTDRPTDGHTLL